MKVIKLHGNSQGDLGGILGGGFAADNISHIHDFKTNSFDRHFGSKIVFSVAPGAAKVSMVVASWLGEVIR